MSVSVSVDERHSRAAAYSCLLPAACADAFGTPYKHILEDLQQKVGFLGCQCRKASASGLCSVCVQDSELYMRTGLLKMMQRNVGVKLAPQRWQENA